MVILLGVLAVAGLVWLARRKRGGDPAARLAAVAASHLPPHRQDWGRAMAAELTQVHGRARRWRFTAGVLRVALFPPPRQQARVLIVACAGLLAAAAATMAAASEAPSLSVFAAVLGLLLCGYATAVASRWHRPRVTPARALLGALGLAGAAAAVATVARVAVAYPAATADPRHVFSVLFAVTLTCYLALALSPFRPGDQPDTALWWALGGTLASGAAWTAEALAASAAPTGAAIDLAPAVAVATLAVSAGAAATTRSRQAGVQAGLLTVVISALVRFTASMTVTLQLHHYTLASAYDIAAYAHSGYPSVASYLLSDAIAGGILGGLVLYPIVLLVIVVLGAAAGTGLRHLAVRRTGA